MEEHVANATSVCGCSALIEPIASPLRVPGSLGETEFLRRLCKKTGSRLLIDVATLLAAGRNFSFNPETWLRGIPPDLIEAVRIGGSSLRSGRWHRDSQGEIDEDAWTLLDMVNSRGRPDILLLDHREPAGGLDDVLVELERLGMAGVAASRAVAIVDAGPAGSG